jgi:hypothetical protein
VGAVACLQGVARAHSRPLLKPLGARKILRETGSPQQDAPGRPASQRIGKRPDLRAAIPRLMTPSDDGEFTAREDLLAGVGQAARSQVDISTTGRPWSRRQPPAR